MSPFKRIFGSVKQTVQDTRGNFNLQKDAVYNFYLNKINHSVVDENHFLNKHDYNILVNVDLKNKDTKLYISEYFKLYDKLSDEFKNIPLSNIIYYYQNHYNRLKNLKEVKNYHLDVPYHIVELEEELFRSVYDMKNTMYSLFESLRNTLKSGCEVLVLEGYAHPQSQFRKLESIEELPIIDEVGYKSYIQSQIDFLHNHFNELDSMVNLLKEQVKVLILYYEQFDNDFVSRCINGGQHINSTNMYAPKIDYSQRASELKELGDIIEGNKG